MPSPGSLLSLKRKEQRNLLLLLKKKEPKKTCTFFEKKVPKKLYTGKIKIYSSITVSAMMDEFLYLT